jgi:hypothetical protein
LASYHNQPHVIVHEAGYKAYHDGMWEDHHAIARLISKLSAWHNKVDDDVGYTHTRCASTSDIGIPGGPAE